MAYIQMPTDTEPQWQEVGIDEVPYSVHLFTGEPECGYCGSVGSVRTEAEADTLAKAWQDHMPTMTVIVTVD